MDVLITGLKTDVIGDFARRDVQLNGVVGVDERIGVADGAAVVCDQVWNLLRSDADALHLAQFVLQK